MSREKEPGMNSSEADSRAGNEGSTKNVQPDSIDIAKRALHLAKTRVAKPCWICGRVVSLESCKTDENGNAVHEECYVARVRLNLPR